MARFNDLESGFEKNLALAYGRHIMVGYSIEHSVNSGAQNMLKVALGDGAPLGDNEGAWCGGPTLTPPVTPPVVSCVSDFDWLAGQNVEIQWPIGTIWIQPPRPASGALITAATYGGFANSPPMPDSSLNNNTEYFEFTVESTHSMCVGLIEWDALFTAGYQSDPTDMLCFLSFSTSTVVVATRFLGTTSSPFSYSVGDVFRLTRISSTMIDFSKNGTLIFSLPITIPTPTFGGAPTPDGLFEAFSMQGIDSSFPSYNDPFGAHNVLLKAVSNAVVGGGPGAGSFCELPIIPPIVSSCVTANTILKLDASLLSQIDGSEINPWIDQGIHGYTFVPFGPSGGPPPFTGPLYDTTPVDNALFSLYNTGPDQEKRAMRFDGPVNPDIGLPGAFTITFVIITEGISRDYGFPYHGGIIFVENPLTFAGWRIYLSDYFSEEVQLLDLVFECVGEEGGGYGGSIAAFRDPSWRLDTQLKLVVSIVCNGTDVRIIVNGQENPIYQPRAAGWLFGMWYNYNDGSTVYTPSGIPDGTIHIGRDFGGPFRGRIPFLQILDTTLSDTNRQALESPLATLYGVPYTVGSASVRCGAPAVPACAPDPGMVFWFKPETLGATASPITTWPDSSPNGFDVTAPVGFEPIVSADPVPGAIFSDTSILLGSTASQLNFERGYTIFLVMKEPDFRSKTIFGKLNLADNQGWSLGRFRSPGYPLYNNNDFQIYNADDRDTEVYYAFGWYMYVGQDPLDNGLHLYTIQMYPDGPFEGTRTIVRRDAYPNFADKVPGDNQRGKGPMPATTNPEPFFIGDHYGYNSIPVYGNFAGIAATLYEAIGYAGNLSIVGINQTEDYLRNKFSLTSPRRTFTTPIEVGRSSSFDSNTVAAPAGTQAGDLVLMVERFNVTGPSDGHFLTGWGSIGSSYANSLSTGIDDPGGPSPTGGYLKIDVQYRVAQGSGEIYDFSSDGLVPNWPHSFHLITLRGIVGASVGDPYYGNGPGRYQFVQQDYSFNFSEPPGYPNSGTNALYPYNYTFPEIDYVADPIYSVRDNSLLFICVIDNAGNATITTQLVAAGTTNPIARTSATNYVLFALLFEAKSTADPDAPVPLCAPLVLGVCPMDVIYDGEIIPPINWHFHPGTLSTGVNDPLQGIDLFFPNGQTYTGTAYLTVVLPITIKGPADPSKLAVIAYTSQIADYDVSGARTAIAYSPNPARVKANMLKRAKQIQRIYWPSYTHSRDYYDALISAPVSNNTYSPFSGIPTYVTLGPIIATAGAINRTSGGSAFDNTAVTVERIVGGDDGHFRITIGGAFPTFTGGGLMMLVDAGGVQWFGIAWGNGHLAIFANSVAIDDITIPYDFPAQAGDVIELGIVGGFFKLIQNGVTKTIPQGPAVAPNTVDLFGRVVLWAASASVTASHFQGSAVVSSTASTRTIPRFEAHPVFTGPVDVGTALDFTDLLCCSDTQEAGRDIVFLTPEPRLSSHVFDDEVNVVGTIKIKSTDVRQRPNRLWAQFRNLDLRYLDPDSVEDKRDALFNRVGRPIDPGPLSFANMRYSQAQRGIKFEMRRRSDRKRWAELRGMPDSLKVLPGDVADVVTSKIRVSVSGGYNSGDVSIDLVALEGLKLPVAPFYATWWNKTDYPNPNDDPEMERVLVTSVVVDTIDMTRAQQGTSASPKNIGGKRYVLGRYPKPFMVITATREPNLERQFTLREYLPDDYRDTDHDIPPSVVGVTPIGGGPPAPVMP